MKVGGDYQLNPHRNRWPDAARDLGLDADEVVTRARNLASTAPDAFTDAAKEPDVTALGSDLPIKLTDLVAGRCVRCARLLGILGRDGFAAAPDAARLQAVAPGERALVVGVPEHDVGKNHKTDTSNASGRARQVK